MIEYGVPIFPLLRFRQDAHHRWFLVGHLLGVAFDRSFDHARDGGFGGNLTTAPTRSRGLPGLWGLPTGNLLDLKILLNGYGLDALDVFGEANEPVVLPSECHVFREMARQVGDLPADVGHGLVFAEVKFNRPVVLPGLLFGGG